MQILNLGGHFSRAKNFIFDIQCTNFLKIMGSLPYFLISKLQIFHFFPKPKFLVLMIHSLMLKLHLICKVGRVGPWNPIQHPSFSKTTYYTTNFSSGCWTSVPMRTVIPLKRGSSSPCTRGTRSPSLHHYEYKTNDKDLKQISYKNVEKKSKSSCSKIQFWSWMIQIEIDTETSYYKQYLIVRPKLGSFWTWFQLTFFCT